MFLNDWRFFGFFKEKEYFHPLILWLILVLWYLIFVHNFQTSPKRTLEHFIAEQSFWLFNETPKEAKEITIVAIDEASRRHLDLKWIWKRSITAELVRNIASFSPEVIGLDIVFAGKSEKEEDQALIAAFKSQPKVVLAYTLDKNSQEKPLKDFIAAASAIGFVNKPLNGDIVDEARTFYNDKNAVAFSLEVAVLLDYMGLDKADITVDRKGIFLRNEPLIPSPQGILPMNYLVHPSKLTTIPAKMVLEKNVNPRDIKGKIVIVGVTDPLIHVRIVRPWGFGPV